MILRYIMDLFQIFLTTCKVEMMSEQVKYLIKVVLVFFCVKSLFDLLDIQSYDIENIINLLSANTSSAAFFAFLYERWLWEYDVFHKWKNINGNYLSEITYTNKSKLETKIGDVKIKQSFLTTRITMQTDEMTSNTISSTLLNENGSQILYYTYIINPKSEIGRAHV